MCGTGLLWSYPDLASGGCGTAVAGGAVPADRAPSPPTRPNATTPIPPSPPTSDLDTGLAPAASAPSCCERRRHHRPRAIHADKTRRHDPVPAVPTDPEPDPRHRPRARGVRAIVPLHNPPPTAYVHAALAQQPTLVGWTTRLNRLCACRWSPRPKRPPDLPPPSQI
jgi:hypothetical protein